MRERGLSTIEIMMLCIGACSLVIGARYLLSFKVELGAARIPIGDATSGAPAVLADAPKPLLLELLPPEASESEGGFIADSLEQIPGAKEFRSQVQKGANGLLGFSTGNWFLDHMATTPGTMHTLSQALPRIFENNLRPCAPNCSDRLVAIVGSADEEDRATAHAELDKIPQNLLELLSRSGQQITIAGEMTDRRPDFKNKLIRPEYDDHISTMDKVGGVSLPLEIIIPRDQVEWAMVHEVGHAINGVAGNPKGSPEFMAAWEKDKAGHEDDYFAVNPDEGWAVAFEGFYGGRSDGDDENLYPETRKFMIEWDKKNGFGTGKPKT